LADDFDDVDHYQGERPWRFDCEVALPCATENELDEDDARRLLDNGCRWLAEGANMPCTAAAMTPVRIT
ncbi:MAG TPA: NADP-specific glutamate dehydrogenase, partial [Alcanivorax sp.]|nr:NADP-specific glutamate dehydrogenase [Alcanivorax sp.]